MREDGAPHESRQGLSFEPVEKVQERDHFRGHFRGDTGESVL